MKGFVASSAESRPKALAVPCKVLVPDFKPTLTIAPGFQPYSAVGFCFGVELLDGVNRQDRSGIAENGGGIQTLCEEKPSTVSIPSRM